MVCSSRASCGASWYARSSTRLIDMHSSADLSARHLLCLDSDVPVIFLIFLLTVFIFSGLCNWQYHSLFTSWECHFHATPRAIISHMYFYRMPPSAVIWRLPTTSPCFSLHAHQYISFPTPPPPHFYPCTALTHRFKKAAGFPCDLLLTLLTVASRLLP